MPPRSRPRFIRIGGKRVSIPVDKYSGESWRQAIVMQRRLETENRKRCKKLGLTPNSVDVV